MHYLFHEETQTGVRLPSKVYTINFNFFQKLRLTVLVKFFIHVLSYIQRFHFYHSRKAIQNSLVYLDHLGFLEPIKMVFCFACPNKLNNLEEDCIYCICR